MNFDLVLLIASIIFTILLAFVGVEMANNPPTSHRAKWIYRSCFIVLGSLLVGTTYWQGKRNIDEQNRIKAVAEAQEKKLDDRYNEIRSQYNHVEGRLGTIQDFAKRPPLSLSPQQVTETIRALAEAGNTQDDYSELPSSYLSDALGDTANELKVLYDRYWTGEDNDIDRQISNAYGDQQKIAILQKRRAQIRARLETRVVPILEQGRSLMRAALRPGVSKRDVDLNEEADLSQAIKLKFKGYSPDAILQHARYFESLAHQLNPHQLNP